MLDVGGCVRVGGFTGSLRGVCGFVSSFILVVGRSFTRRIRSLLLIDLALRCSHNLALRISLGPVQCLLQVFAGRGITVVELLTLCWRSICFVSCLVFRLIFNLVSCLAFCLDLCRIGVADNPNPSDSTGDLVGPIIFIFLAELMTSRIPLRLLLIVAMQPLLA